MAPGQTFRWRSPKETSEGVAVAIALRSDQEEGLSPEVDQYAARWMDARALQGPRSGEVITFLLGTDERVYLDGQEVFLTFVESPTPAP